MYVAATLVLLVSIGSVRSQSAFFEPLRAEYNVSTGVTSFATTGMLVVSQLLSAHAPLALAGRYPLGIYVALLRSTAQVTELFDFDFKGPVTLGRFMKLVVKLVSKYVS